MNHRHAAALGLLIWYFMVPVAPNPKSDTTTTGTSTNGHSSEPSQWRVEKRLETLHECRVFQWVYLQRFGGPGAATFAGGCGIGEPRRGTK